MVAPYCFTNNRHEAEYENVPVLVVNHAFDKAQELMPFVKSMIEGLGKNKPSAVVVVAKHFSIDFQRTMAETVRLAGLPFVLVQNSSIEDDVFEDVAAFCAAKYVDTHPKTGRKITDVTFAAAGNAAKIVAGLKDTIFINGKGLELGAGKQATTPVNERVMAIRAQLETEQRPDKRVQMERRMAALLGGIATIYIDAKTAAEKYYLKLKVEDALNSCKRALVGGVLPGGGVALSKVADKLGENSLLYRALKAPFNRVVQNAGGSLVIAEDVRDAAIVVKSALANAVSVVKVLITTEGIITEPERDIAKEFAEKLGL
jgi:chaperonin GroEL